MLFNLNGKKALALADNKEVSAQLEMRGFYLQMPQQEENLLESFRIQQQFQQ